MPAVALLSEVLIATMAVVDRYVISYAKTPRENLVGLAHAGQFCDELTRRRGRFEVAEATRRMAARERRASPHGEGQLRSVVDNGNARQCDTRTYVLRMTASPRVVVARVIRGWVDSARANG